MNNYIFSIIDVETTGLVPEMGDRIIEIAIINMDINGKVLIEFESLINPNRDLGPTHIHNITASMVKNAPQFKDIAKHIFKLISGNILVGHNLNFDYRFIKNEFGKIDTTLPKINQLCTLNLSRKLFPTLPSQKLGNICKSLNIKTGPSHCAYGDCISTKNLLNYMLQNKKAVNLIMKFSSNNQSINKYLLLIDPKGYKRSSYSSTSIIPSYISDLISKLPPLTSIITKKGETDYLNLLDQVLSDRRITEEEIKNLSILSTNLGLGKNEVIELNKKYLLNLFKVANSDNIISDYELRDLTFVSKLLGLDEKYLIKCPDLIKHDNITISKNEYAGKKVCFTGTMTSSYNSILITRDIAHNLAKEKGFFIGKGVTNDLDYLVVADPDSMSGKAKKARDKGIKIIAEQAFWFMLGIQVE